MKSKIAGFLAGAVTTAAVGFFVGGWYCRANFEEGYQLGLSSGKMRGEMAAYECAGMIHRFEQDRKIMQAIERQYEADMQRRMEP